MRQSTPITTLTLLLTTTLTTAQSIGPIYTSSFTWNANCGPTVACGPSAAGSFGTGYAAANNVTYANNQPIVGGVGAGCGQCWHLQPISDAYQSNGKSLGTPVVIKINDQCTDPKYCDQEEFGNNTPLNTGYGKQVHFDLCNSSGVTNQFFGQIDIGVALGFAQQIECSSLNHGSFGSKMGAIREDATAGAKGNTEVVAPKAAEPVVGAGQNNLAAANVGGAQTSSTAVATGQPSTLISMVSSSTPVSSPVAGSGDDEQQDECDEL